MPRRFHLPRLTTATELLLGEEETHHLRRVLRLQPGDQVVLFDGTGEEALAEILEHSTTGTRLRILERRPASPETGIPFVLATAVPKGDRFRWLVEKATELGVQRMIPLITERSIVDPRDGKLDRLRQTIVEASKQCGRSRLMELDQPISWKEFLATEIAPGVALWVADPSGVSWPPAESQSTGGIIGAVGPEGGFTPAELESARTAGAQIIRIGNQILRIETAGVALATARLLLMGHPKAE